MQHTFETLLKEALERRGALLDALHAEHTNAYRLFHGTNEGKPGVTIDRYGPQILIQSFHQPLETAELRAIQAWIPDDLGVAQVVYNDRSSKHSRRKDAHITDDEVFTATEIGVKYTVQGKHSSQDPYLFLDFRAARRKVLELAEGKSVLNLFAYTCGMGVCAAVAGASKVTNIDFSASYLDIGRQNALLNQVGRQNFVQSDFFPAVRQLAGLPVKQRGKPRKFLKLKPETYDLVVLDPPRYAKSPFGTVDLIRDYQSLLKPSVLATSENGQLLCTNNVAKVDFEDWQDAVLRCAAKAGRPVKSWDRIWPETDFPSRDGNPPLKMLLLQL